jgi:predicted dehydrogenase/threonine dehydrogenase-like Zn-dependent dehydrogenase
VKQLVQNVSNGEITVEQVPAPARAAGAVLVASRFSLISAGTERAVVELGRRSLAGKARARPDLARQVVETARTEGIATTVAKVRGALSVPTALGYSLAGTVLETGEDGPAAPGELVACAGARHAGHAEIVSVPRRLCARVPEGVRPEDAAYGTVAAIAMHGVRLSGAGLGDVAAVVGLGLVGQLTLELLAASGCVALGVDPDAGRVELAREAGFFATADPADLFNEAARLTGARGADAVVVAAASASPEALATGCRAARERATICIVGDVPVEASRQVLFEKELRLVVSRSYGPGRYDPVYEERGIDYPAGYVRWTEERNLEEALRLMATGALRPARLTTHTLDLDEAPAAYELLEGEEPALGILLRYPGGAPAAERTVPVEGRRLRRPHRARELRVGVVGAGAFARGVLLPHFSRRSRLVAVATATGLSAAASAKRFGAEVATTDAARVLEADDIDAVVIATRHDTHAAYAARALAAGKHVFVEKPLAIDEPGLADIEQAARGEGLLMVGFNRRFAPLALRLREALGGRGPLVITYRVSASRLPSSHWTRDPEVGGGRIVGEACHFVDFASFLCGGAHITSVTARALGGGFAARDDNVVATLQLADGSLASIAYSALGDPRLPKERVEVLGEAGSAVLDDFRTLLLARGGDHATEGGRQDKGHRGEVEAFVDACRAGSQPWPVEEMAGVTRTTFAIRAEVQALS